ncbi:MAG: patatin-like phospholipase family protein [candidate division Zixibacteria bacterium]|nr:patatin-like phospholipase family protein [candidate division Zixibacteria bacterium]
MKTVALLLLCSWILASVSAGAEERFVVGGLEERFPSCEEPSRGVVLALSGGGARGLATIGILRALEEKDIGIAAIAGASMGGIVGGLYATGYTAEQLTSIVHNLDFDGLFGNAPDRSTMFQTKRRGRGRDLLTLRFDGFLPIIPQALTTGQKLTEILTRLTTRATYRSGGDFSQLPIPFATVSSDMITGEEVILDHGSLADAMRATLAFPLAFTGVEINGRLLVDGGMVNPMPVNVARSLCDVPVLAIAINTSSPLLKRDEIATPVDIVNQATSIMTKRVLRQGLASADFVITPVGNNIHSTDFRLKDSIIELGYQAGLMAVDSILSLLSQRRDTTRYTFSVVRLDTGLSPHRAQIEAILLQQQLNRPEFLAALKSLREELGFFQLEVGISTDSNSTGKHTCVSLSGFECLDPARVKFSFVGNQVFSDSVLVSQMELTDSALTPLRLDRVLHSAMNRYRADGYDLADIRSVNVDPVSNSAAATIDEAVIRRVEIAGHGRTKAWFIRSLFPMKAGEPYSTRRAAQGINNIYGTDLFYRVSADLVPEDSGAVVRIVVREKKPFQMRLGWHWDDEYQSEEFIELLDDNIGGVGLELLGHARYSPDRQHYFLNFKADRIFSSYMTGAIRFYHTQLDRHLYDGNDSLTGKHQELKLGTEFRIGRQISRLGTVAMALVIEEIDYFQENREIDEELGLRIFKLESLVENFDRIPFPHRGKKHFFELQFAGRLLGGDVDYTRFFTSIEAYFPLGKYLNYHPRLGVGISRSGLPMSERFYMGGLRSFHGYRSGQLSGDKMFLLSQQLRIKLPLWLYLSGYFDLGNIYGSTDEIKLSHLRRAFGVCLSLDTPLGPAEIGYGATEDDLDRIYIRVGFEF